MSLARTLGILFLCFATSCTVSPEQKARTWLDQGGKTIAVRIDEALPSPEYQVHESRAWEGAGEGAKKALSGGPGGGDPITLVLMVVVIPIMALGGAAVGAATADPEVHHYSLDKVEGAAALLEASSEDANFVKLLASNIQRRSVTRKGHTLKVVSMDTPTAPGAANLMITVKTYALVGELEDNPSVALRVAGNTDIQTPDGDGWYSCGWSYKGSERRLSDWSANDGKLFRNEVSRAALQVTENVLATLEWGAGRCLERLKRSTPVNYDRVTEKKKMFDQARKGDPDAQFKYALYIDDFQDQYRWFCFAAHQSHPGAQHKVGEFYRLGRPPVSQSYSQAYMWYTLSAEQGNTAAQTALRPISRVLSPAQIGEAERLVAEWEPNPAECEIYSDEADAP